jgi:hypothetical protein
MSENTPPPADDAAAARKRAKQKARNKAKKARQKAKKRGAAGRPAAGRPAARPGYANRTRRGSAGKGRGQGLFALERIPGGEVAVRARPALSTVFDAHARTVCGFCFATAASSAAANPPTSHTLMLRKAGGRLSVFVAERDVTFGEGGLGGAPGKGVPVCCAVINGCAPGSPNEGAGILPGDVVESVCGEFMTPGAGALQRCLAALAGSNTVDGEPFPVVVRRPSLQACDKCQRFATCGACCAKGLKAWHESHECKTYRHLPASATKGETSPMRMMLRHRAIAERGDWASPCPAVEGRGSGNGDGASNIGAATIEGQPAAAGTALGDKESLALVATLQANKDVVSQTQKLALAGMTGVKPEVVSLLIGQIRGNAAGILRDGQKVGCALSVLMGYCNHDCTPNAEACVDKDGFVTITALENIAAGEEVCISYVDRNAFVLDRRATLLDHYEFECRCVRCLKEHREYLKAKARNRGHEYLMNNSKLARNAYLHGMGGAGSSGASSSVSR